MPTRNVLLQATLLSDSAPISGKTITFMHRPSGTTTWIVDGTGTTDPNGVASITITVDVPGTYDFRAEFAGDDYYDASYAEVTNFTIKAKTTITLTVIPQ